MALAARPWRPVKPTDRLVVPAGKPAAGGRWLFDQPRNTPDWSRARRRSERGEKARPCVGDRVENHYATCAAPYRVKPTSRWARLVTEQE